MSDSISDFLTAQSAAEYLLSQSSSDAKSNSAVITINGYPHEVKLTRKSYLGGLFTKNIFTITTASAGNDSSFSTISLKDRTTLSKSNSTEPPNSHLSQSISGFLLFGKIGLGSLVGKVTNAFEFNKQLKSFLGNSTTSDNAAPSHGSKITEIKSLNPLMRNQSLSPTIIESLYKKLENLTKLPPPDHSKIDDARMYRDLMAEISSMLRTLQCHLDDYKNIKIEDNGESNYLSLCRDWSSDIGKNIGNLIGMCEKKVNESHKMTERCILGSNL
jgi:hypothetical protein